MSPTKATSTTTNLGEEANRGSIRTELLAQQDINTAIKIEKLLLYLEGKGQSENTVLAYSKNLFILAREAGLQNPIEVEKAIASYM